MSIFKKNFLPAQSQPWARQVEDRVRFFEGGLNTLDVNNRSKDEQFSAALKRLDAATITAQASADAAAAAAATANGIINNIYTPGTTNINGTKLADGTIGVQKLVAGTITGDVINGGTITGVTIRSAASGQRVEVSSTEVDFYNTAGALAGTIIGSTQDNINSVRLVSETGVLVLANGSSAIFGGTNPSAFTVLAGNTQVNDGSFAVGDGNAIFNNDAIVGGSLTRTVLAGGGTTGASINNTGNFIRTTSSERYKTDISDLEIPYESVLQLQPKKFKRTEESEKNPDAKFYPGFIAEDLAGTDLDIFTFYSKDEDGNSRPEGVHYAELTAALVSAIKTQDQMIKSLEARLTALESR
jgi:hypothetical protein